MNKLNNRDNIEFIDMDNRILNKDMINSDGTICNKIIASEKNKYIDVRFINGDKVPQILLDNLDSLSIRDKAIGFHTIIKDANSVLSGALDNILRKSNKLTFKNVRNIDFDMLSRINVEFRDECNIEVISDEYVRLYGSTYYSQRDYITLDAKIEFVSEDFKINADIIKLGKNIREEDLKSLSKHMENYKQLQVSKDLIEKAKEIFNNSDKIQLLEE